MLSTYTVIISGRQCSRTTCIYPGLCFQHFRAKHNLKLAPSKVPGAGLGLYTLKAIQPFRKITNYTGKMMSEKDWTNNPSDYGVGWDNNQILDARSTQDAIGR